MAKPDVTRVNDAIDRLVAVTTNPRHRFLEIAGRYAEIFAADKMVERPVYRFRALGLDVRLEGAEAIRALYGMWARTHQSIFYVEREQVAVADNFIATVAWGYQQVLGEGLIANGIEVDDRRRTTATRSGASSSSGATTSAAGSSARTSGSRIPTGGWSRGSTPPM
jgi:hypothetical protein